MCGMQEARDKGNLKKGSDPGQLRWRCRRGMQELDVLLTRFLEQQFSRQPVAVRNAFVRLLDAPDDRLWDWLSGQKRPRSGELADVVKRIRATTAD